ncbi:MULTISPECIES: hypothetical protein [unclassified Nocardioides]|uniref:LysM peptidoglycan-binding domain-containing protein n=1 Tax=unclassified Nocardioides TaxID=2615069 RepID=UPI000056FB9D|nr:MULTISPECIES: hypothetical protein [unclassified Nocardioides]ABL80956.1 hypothetical protein Noca_1442 [Nocardioides sp. JS614]
MHASATRCLAVWAAASALAAALGAWLLPVAVGDAGSRFDLVLVRACAAVALVGTCWLWLAASATVVAALRGRPARAPGVPAVVRRLVLAACGAGLAAGLVAPAQATPGDVHVDRQPTAGLAGLPLPDRAVGLPGRALLSHGAPRPTTAPGRLPTVVVRPGDSLWELAATHLDDPGRWPQIYALNRDQIGPDPGLIQPATRLRLPADRPEETS